MPQDGKISDIEAFRRASEEAKPRKMYNDPAAAYTQLLLLLSLCQPDLPLQTPLPLQ